MHHRHDTTLTTNCMQTNHHIHAINHAAYYLYRFML